MRRRDKVAFAAGYAVMAAAILALPMAIVACAHVRAATAYAAGVSDALRAAPCRRCRARGDGSA